MLLIECDLERSPTANPDWRLESTIWVDEIRKLMPEFGQHDSKI